MNTFHILRSNYCDDLIIIWGKFIVMYLTCIGKYVNTADCCLCFYKKLGRGSFSLNFTFFAIFALGFWGLTVMFAWIVCFLPDGSINRQVNSSTEAETTWSLGCERGKAFSKLRISTFSTLRQAIIKNLIIGYCCSVLGYIFLLWYLNRQN